MHGIRTSGALTRGQFAAEDSSRSKAGLQNAILEASTPFPYAKVRNVRNCENTQ